MQSVDIAQAAGATFDVWFKVVAGAVVTLMALVLFFNFRRVELVGRPESFAKNMFLQLGTAQPNMFLQFEEQRNIAN